MQKEIKVTVKGKTVFANGIPVASIEGERWQGYFFESYNGDNKTFGYKTNESGIYYTDGYTGKQHVSFWRGDWAYFQDAAKFARVNSTEILQVFAPELLVATEPTPEVATEPTPEVATEPTPEVATEVATEPKTQLNKSVNVPVKIQVGTKIITPNGTFTVTAIKNSYAVCDWVSSDGKREQNGVTFQFSYFENPNVPNGFSIIQPEPLFMAKVRRFTEAEFYSGMRCLISATLEYFGLEYSGNVGIDDDGKKIRLSVFVDGLKEKELELVRSYKNLFCPLFSNPTAFANKDMEGEAKLVVYMECPKSDLLPNKE